MFEYFTYVIILIFIIIDIIITINIIVCQDLCKNDALRNYIVQRHTSNVNSLLQIRVSPLGFPYQYFDLHPISTADEFVFAVSS